MFFLGFGTGAVFVCVLIKIAIWCARRTGGVL